MLPFDTKAVSHLAVELDEWRSLLDYRGPLPRTWAGRLRRDLEAEAIAASTSMEGVAVTVEEVHRILAGDNPSEVTPEDVRLVRGYKEAMGFVLRRADDPAFDWNRELMVALHDRILAGSSAAGAGRFREGPVFVVDRTTREEVFVPPASDEVPRLIDQACHAMTTWREHPALGAAWIHAAIAAVHPFKDGNGRSARVLASLTMYRGGFKLPEFTSLEEWWGRHLADYYGAFACLGDEFDVSADVTPFIRAHMEAQLSQVRALDLREEVQRRIWTAIEESLDAIGVHQRLANAVWDAFFGRQVTSRYYRPLADVGPVTAANDLAAGVAAGLLRAEGAGRNRHYGAGGRLYTQLGEALGVEIPVSDDTARSVIVRALTDRVASRAHQRQLRERKLN